MDPWILRLESWKKKYRNLNPPVSRDSGGFWFLVWNESGFEEFCGGFVAEDVECDRAWVGGAGA